MMNMIAGGATARPFITHHHDLDMQVCIYPKPSVMNHFESAESLGAVSRTDQAIGLILTLTGRAQL